MKELARVWLIAFALAVGVASTARADPPPVAAAPAASQGVGVLATGDTRDEAFALARAVYGSALRPPGLDELRARILAGDPPPPSASRELQDLATLRASVHGDDAASRQLLVGIAAQLHVQALLVLSRGPSAGEADVDGGAPVARLVSARLFLVEGADFDAARYEASENDWHAIVRSISPRFPPPAPAPTPVARKPAPPKPTSENSPRPFYLSPWLWGAVGAAVVLGGILFFTARDTSDDPIQLRMRVPH